MEVIGIKTKRFIPAEPAADSVQGTMQNFNFTDLLAHEIMREWKRLNGVTSHGFVRAASSSFYHSVSQ